MAKKMFNFIHGFIYGVPKIHTKILISISKIANKTNLENKYTHRGAYVPMVYAYV